MSSTYSAKVQGGLQSHYKCPACGLKFRSLWDSNAHYVKFHIQRDHMHSSHPRTNPVPSTSSRISSTLPSLDDGENSNVSPRQRTSSVLSASTRTWIEPTSPSLEDGKRSKERHEQMLIESARSSVSSLQRPKVGKMKRKYTMKTASNVTVEEEAQPSRKVTKLKSKTQATKSNCTICGARFDSTDDVKSHIIGEHLQYMVQQIDQTSQPSTNTV